MNKNADNPFNHTHRRSCLERASLWSFALLSLAGWLRLARSVTDWYWLQQAGVAPGVLTLAVGGAVWGLLGMIAFGVVWLRRQDTRWIGFSSAAGLAVMYWIDRLWISSPDVSWVNLPFAIVLTLLAITLTWVLFFRSRGFIRK